MPIQVSRCTHGRREVVAEFPTFDQCEAWAKQAFNVAFFDRDADYQDCADFLTSWGEVYAIEPKGFRL